MSNIKNYDEEDLSSITGGVSGEKRMIGKINNGEEDEARIFGYVTPTGQISGALYDTELEIKVDITESGPRGPKGDHGDGEGTGTKNYLELENLPKIQSIELRGNKSFKDLGVDSIFKKDIDTLF